MPMDIKKLKLDSFKRFNVVNFPEGIETGLHNSTNDIEVIIYYIDTLEDVKRFVALCESSNLPKENRTIMVYKKGRKDGLNRDSIFMPFKDNIFTGFKLKAPMLCSLSSEFSACVMCKIQV
jgi:hypothetical protein